MTMQTTLLSLSQEDGVDDNYMTNSEVPTAKNCGTVTFLA